MTSQSIGFSQIYTIRRRLTFGNNKLFNLCLLNWTLEWAKLVQWCGLCNIRLSWNENCWKKQSSQFSKQFCPNPRLRSWVLGNDRKNTIASASVQNEIFAKNWRSYVIQQSA